VISWRVSSLPSFRAAMTSSSVLFSFTMTMSSLDMLLVVVLCYAS
jgi:hypothetical protein